MQFMVGGFNVVAAKPVQSFRSLSVTYRLHKREQSFFISLPFWVKLHLCGEFVAAEFHSDFQTIGVQVVEV